MNLDPNSIAIFNLKNTSMSMNDKGCLTLSVNEPHLDNIVSSLKTLGIDFLDRDVSKLSHDKPQAWLGYQNQALKDTVTGGLLAVQLNEKASNLIRDLLSDVFVQEEKGDSFAAKFKFNGNTSTSVIR